MATVAEWAATLGSKLSGEDRSRALWKASGVPARAEGYRLGTFPSGQSKELRRLVEGLTARAGATWEGFWGRSWYLWGESGRGKTGLAVGYAWQWVDPQFGDPARVVYWSVADLMSELQSSYDGQGAEWQILRRAREADLLVLDDLGREHESASGWAAAKLYQVINGRYSDLAPVVVTSNYSPAALAEKLGDAGRPVVWRLAEMCGRDGVVRVEGPNLREGRVLSGGD